MVRVENIVSSYGKKKVLDQVSFQCESGSCCAVVGSNGSGKSTLLSILAGIKKPDHGSIYYNNKNMLKQKRREFYKMAGYVPQENPLIPELTVKDNLLLWYLDKRLLEREKEQGELSGFHLGEYWKVPVHKLSGGMKKRVSIACALAVRPPILILDEPTAALDMICKQEIKRYLARYREQGGTVIFSTHDETELEICSKLYILNHHTLQETDVTARGSALTAMQSGQNGELK